MWMRVTAANFPGRQHHGWTTEWSESRFYMHHRVVGKSILYSPHDLQLNTHFGDLATRNRSHVKLADVPEPGGIVRRGRPILTVIVTADSRDQVVNGLRVSSHLQGGELLAVQAFTDLLQGETDLPQGHDLLQADDLVPPVESMTRFRAPRWHQEADLLVVVERANRDTGAPG